MLFEKVGKVNTEKSIELALSAAKEQGINDIVVASVTGYSAQMLKNTGHNVVCVTHAFGYITPGENELAADVRTELEDGGINILTGAHVLSGAERSLSTQFSGVYPVEVMAFTLRMFGEGTKVCVECAAMALDAGLVPAGKRIIAIGGTGRGADTVAVLTPSYTCSILKTKIHELICKPAF